MSTYEPDKLVSLWAQEQIDIDMAMGYNLQNSAKLHKIQTATNISLYELRSKVDTLVAKDKARQAEIDRLQTLIDGLIAHTDIKPTSKGKQKPTKKS